MTPPANTYSKDPMTRKPSLTQRVVADFNEMRTSDAYTGAQVLTLVMFAGGSGAAIMSPSLFPESAQIVLMLGAVAALLSAPDLVTFLQAKAQSRR